MIQLFNLTGQLIEAVSYGKRSQGDHEIFLNTEKLANGTYMLCLKDGRNTHSSIIIVQH